MLDATSGLIKRCFPSSASELVVGGCTASDLVAEFGSPVFVYDANVMRRSWNDLRAALPSAFDICYSVKANPHPRIVQLFLREGARLEIASVGELHVALAAGCDPDRVLFAGPGKSYDELETAVRLGIGEIHVESTTEASRLADIARSSLSEVRVAIRVNPGSEARGGAMRMGGKPAPFGVDEEQLDGLVDQIEAAPGLRLTGIHLFAGTQILDHDVLIAQYSAGLEIAANVAQRIGRPIETLDFGGGLGVPYFEKESPLDLHAFGVGLAELFGDIDPSGPLGGTQFLVEPGRYLVGESGVYLTRVLDKKLSRDKWFVVVDGGMHHHLAASGNLGQVIKRNFPVVAASRLLEPSSQAVDVVGPLCTPLDVLGRNLELPAVRIGDIVAVLQSGAYARSASPLGFLSHPEPAEVWVEDGRAELIRTKGSIDDWSRGWLEPGGTLSRRKVGRCER